MAPDEDENPRFDMPWSGTIYCAPPYFNSFVGLDLSCQHIDFQDRI